MGFACRRAFETSAQAGEWAGVVGWFGFRASAVQWCFGPGKLNREVSPRCARGLQALLNTTRRCAAWKAAAARAGVEKSEHLRGVQCDRRVSLNPRQDFDDDHLAQAALRAAVQGLPGEGLIEVSIIPSGVRQQAGDGRQKQFPAQRYALTPMNIGE